MSLLTTGCRDNNDRANGAAAALEAYTATNSGRYHEETVETRVGDLLCDLMHLVRRDGNPVEWVSGDKDPDFRDPLFLLDRARMNFEEEEEEEGTDDEDNDDAPETALDNQDPDMGDCGTDEDDEDDYAERHPIQLRKEQAAKA